MITLRDFQNSWHIALVPLNIILNYSWILKNLFKLSISRLLENNLDK